MLARNLSIYSFYSEGGGRTVTKSLLNFPNILEINEQTFRFYFIVFYLSSDFENKINRLISCVAVKMGIHIGDRLKVMIVKYKVSIIFQLKKTKYACWISSQNSPVYRDSMYRDSMYWDSMYRDSMYRDSIYRDSMYRDSVYLA